MAPKSSLLQKALILGDARITAPLLFAICYYPEKLQRILPSQLSWITSKAFIRTLGLIAIFDTVRKVNSKLSDRLLNNGEPVAKFKKSQEIVLITGGASGIGASVAKKLAAMGVKVVIMDLNSPEEVVCEFLLALFVNRRLTMYEAGVTFFKVDITSSKEISEAASEIRKSVGEPTVLINNAGIGTVRTILGGSEAGIRQTFEVNTMAHFWLVKEFVPAMIKKNHGHIVTIASMASFVVHARNVDYCCTKASCVAFHEGLASELKHVYDAPNVKTS